MTTLSYSLFFKDHIIIDVMMIAAGFLWSAAGAVVIDAPLGVAPPLHRLSRDVPRL